MIFLNKNKLVRSLILGLNIFLQSHLCHAQVTFDRTYDSGGSETLFNILTFSFGYAIAMNVNQSPDKLQIIKLDLIGDTTNSRTYEILSAITTIYSFKKTSDSSFISGSFLYDLTNATRNVFLLKFDHNLDTLWTKKISPPPNTNYNGNYLIETSDKGFLVTGQVYYPQNNEGDFFILKTDSTGNFQWIQTFGGTNNDAAFSSIETPDKGFLTLGWTHSFGFGNANNRDDLLVKWDSLGNYQWHKTFGTTDSEYAIGITACSDGNYLLASYKFNQFTTTSLSKIIKVDVDGNMIWQQYYSTVRSQFWWARERSNLDIIAIGSERNSNNKDDGFIVCTDSSGNEKWRRLYRVGTNHCYFRDVQETPDGGIICAGFVFQGASGGQDGWLVKLDSTGCLAAGNCGVPTGLFEAQSATQYEVTVYPNPVKDQAIVKIDGLPQRLMDESYRLRVYDLQRRLVQEPVTGFLVADNWIQCIFRRGSLNSGIYLLEVSTYNDERLGMVKVVVE